MQVSGTVDALLNDNDMIIAADYPFLERSQKSNMRIYYKSGFNGKLAHQNSKRNFEFRCRTEP